MTLLENEINLTDLVKKARSGCQESMEKLAQQAQPVLFTYIYRLTLNHNIAEDLRQETLLEMIKSLKKLEHPDRFQAWLYRTALGKVQHYFRDRQYEKIMQPISALDKEKLLQRVSRSDGGALKNMIDKELSQAIVDAMAKLKLEHRNILVLRCYEKLPYSKIAEMMNCTELAAEVLFFRAKHALKRKLSRSGFGKGLLVLGLGLFGQMTAPVDAATVIVSADSVKVGIAATGIGAVGTKLGLAVAAIIAVAAFAVGSFFFMHKPDDVSGFVTGTLPKRADVKSFHYYEQVWDSSASPIPTNLNRGRSLSKGSYEQWYYFPEGIDGPMFMMMQRWDPQQTTRLCGWLQNSSGNYYYHSGEKTIYLLNYHIPRSNLSTRRLTSDPPELTEFLDKVEESVSADYVRDPKTGLLVGILDNRFYNAKNFKSSINYNELNEKSFGAFAYSWPKDAPVIDQRDAMHKRGWSYFRISGQINHEQVRGYGRIPFIYDAYRQLPPWLRLKIGSTREIIDSESGAYLIASDGKAVLSCPSGSFFKGLVQPWMGMNMIDIIRRDAASQKIRFTIKNFENDDDHYGKAEIVLFGQANGRQIRIVYTIDIDKDIIEKIEFLADDKVGNNQIGSFEFTYIDEIEQLNDEFAEPNKINPKVAKNRDNMGMLWLMELAQGTLGQ